MLFDVNVPQDIQCVSINLNSYVKYQKYTKHSHSDFLVMHLAITKLKMQKSVVNLQVSLYKWDNKFNFIVIIGHKIKLLNQKHF